VVIAAAVLFVATSALMAQTRRQVRIIGDVAAPQAATAADLYFALSDLDAQVVRLVLAGDDATLAATQIDALATYRERNAAATSTATTPRRPTCCTCNSCRAPSGYARRARIGSIRRTRPRTPPRSGGIVVALGPGALLVVLLLVLQVWLARRFRRMFNPALLVATVLTIALAGPAAIVFAVQGQRLGDARSHSLNPYLELSQARAISYDAAADTSRYLISAGRPTGAIRTRSPASPTAATEPTRWRRSPASGAATPPSTSRTSTTRSARSPPPGRPTSTVP
jgi:hypothetical protein